MTHRIGDRVEIGYWLTVNHEEFKVGSRGVVTHVDDGDHVRVHLDGATRAITISGRALYPVSAVDQLGRLANE